MNTKLLAQLFLTFAKVGVMTFGGGMAMLPILQREVVEDKGWATDEELVDYFAIGQCTPGIIAVNTATFIGQKQAGIIGGIVATLGIVFPSLIIITALAGVINSFSHLAWVQHAFAGIRVCVCVLIFNAVVKLFKGSVKDWAAGLIFLAVLAAALLTDLSPVIFVAAAAALGIVIQNVIRGEIMLYLQLFWEFFKTGLFAVGGGLATLPFLQDMADRTGWFTHAQLADMLAVSESTPGPIGVNMATYVGFTTGGIGGALVATIGLVTPSVIVILIVAAFLKAFRDSKWVSAAFYGLRPASTALVAAAGISVVPIALLHSGMTGLAALNWPAIALAAVLLMCTNWVPVVKKWHPIVFIGISALVGVLLKF